MSIHNLEQKSFEIY